MHFDSSVLFYFRDVPKILGVYILVLLAAALWRDVEWERAHILLGVSLDFLKAVKLTLKCKRFTGRPATVLVNLR